MVRPNRKAFHPGEHRDEKRETPRVGQHQPCTEATSQDGIDRRRGFLTAFEGGKRYP